MGLTNINTYIHTYIHAYIHTIHTYRRTDRQTDSQTGRHSSNYNCTNTFEMFIALRVQLNNNKNLRFHVVS